MKIKNLMIGTGVLLATSSMFSAHAEEGDAGVTIERQIEEVIVTGLRRAETVMQTPAAISALSADFLESKGLSDMTQIQHAVPSLHFGEAYANRNIAIRGIGGFLEQPGVITSLNGVVQPSDTSSQISQLDLERIEVLRGPQGTLLGRNATGGAVNFIAASPTEDFYGKIKVGYAEFDQKSVEFVASGSVSDRLGIRLAANHLDAGEGWVNNLVAGDNDLMMGEKTNVRLIMTAQVTDSMDAELMIGHSEQSGRWTHWAMIKEHIAYGTATGLPSVSVVNDPAGEPILYSVNPHEVYMKGPINTDRELDMYSLTMNWDLETFSIKSITAFQDWSNSEDLPADSTSSGILQRSTLGANESFSQEITISGQFDKLDWIVGGFYMDDERTDDFKVSFSEALPAFGIAPVITNLRPLYDNKARAVFADMTYSMSEDLRLGLGLRHTREEKTHGTIGTFSADFGAGLVALTKSCEPDWPRAFVQSWEDSSNTMRASAEYDATDTSMVYMSFSEGFKSGGANNGDCNAPWNPETVEATEVGYKASFADGSTTIRAAAFYYDYSDFQLLQVRNFAGIITNAGDAEVKGLEVEMTSAVNENWLINSGITLLDSEYGDFLNEDLLRPGTLFQNKGNSLNNAPETSLTLGITYSTELSSGGAMALSLDGSYRSRIYFREFGIADDSQEAYTIVNFNANWKSSDKETSARFFVTNLTDEDHITGMYGLQTTYGRQGTWNMPRQVGLELTRFFGNR